MKKIYLSGFFLVFILRFFLPVMSSAGNPAISKDTVFYVNFTFKPGAFTSGDIFTASTANANKESTINGIIFGAGPNGQRINMNTSQSASQFGSTATTYVSATADDDGANTGAFSFIRAGSGNAKGYIILPEVQGPADITVWACGANTSATQSYELFSSNDGGTTWISLGTASFTDLKLIHKNIFSYTQGGNVKIKLVCTTGSNSNCNLYIYDVLMTKRPYIALTSTIGTDNQTVSTFDHESISNIVYTWGSIATSATINWTGTADANTPPTGISVNIDASAQTLTLSGTPTVLGTYSYNITGTNGTLSTDALTGTIKVVDTPVPLLTLTSTAGTNTQNVIAGTAINTIEYTWGGSAIDANISWSGTASASTAPDGISVTKDSPNEKISITGTPTSAGTYGWSISSTDNTLASAALTGTLSVIPPPTITLTSDAATSNQMLAFCQTITPVVLTYGGSAVSATVAWTGTSSASTPPAGITATTNTTDKTLTISGILYLTGNYGFSVKSTDGTLSSTAVSGTLISSATASALPSFPGAVGYGSHATGGRKGTVYHVTNLDDSGPGSFRDAVSASNRIVVFDVSGYINLKTAVSCKSNLTIAGQTAPGGGIGFRAGEISFAKSENIICRHIRIVPGNETADAVNDDALSLYLARNVIMDHCTFEFAPWNNIDGVSDNYTVYPVTAITLQNCIDANPTGQQFGAHCESVLSQWTFYRNLFANSHNRNPLAKINDQFINNVHYNNEAGYTTHTSANFKHDIVNNYFVWGPASGSNVPWFQIDANQSIYYPGNLLDNNLDGSLNGTTTTPYWYSGTGTILTTPWSPLTSTIPTVDASSAFRTVVSMAGALPFSQLDSLIINQVKTLGTGTAGKTAGTSGPEGGLYLNQTQTGLPNNGYGTIITGTKEKDTDNDGMPDFWEAATGSDVNTDDAMQTASNGYTRIENYINWMADPHTRTTVNTAVDIDLSNYSGGFAGVSPAFSTSNPLNGTVSLNTDGHTARFIPTTGFSGIASFRFTVTGNDNTSYTDSIRIAVSGTAIPTITSVTSATRCNAGTVTLLATASAGTVNWYDVQTGGTALGTGNSFTTPSISATTTYYAEAIDNGVSSASRTSVTATVNTTPAITSTTPASRSGAGTVVLGATASDGVINWYAAATGGTSLGTGTNFTTPGITTTTSYFVDATANSCTTSTRTVVVATVTTPPTGIDLVQGDKSFILSPNPVTDLLTITTGARIQKVEIYSMAGVLVKTEKDYAKSIDMSKLTQGCYMVIVFTDRGVCKAIVMKK